MESVREKFSNALDLDFAVDEIASALSATGGSHDALAEAEAQGTSVSPETASTVGYIDPSNGYRYVCFPYPLEETLNFRKRLLDYAMSRLPLSIARAQLGRKLFCHEVCVELLAAKFEGFVMAGRALDRLEVKKLVMWLIMGNDTAPWIHQPEGVEVRWPNTKGTLGLEKPDCAICNIFYVEAKRLLERKFPGVQVHCGIHDPDGNKDFVTGKNYHVIISIFRCATGAPASSASRSNASSGGGQSRGRGTDGKGSGSGSNSSGQSSSPPSGGASGRTGGSGAGGVSDRASPGAGKGAGKTHHHAHHSDDAGANQHHSQQHHQHHQYAQHKQHTGRNNQHHPDASAGNRSGAGTGIECGISMVSTSASSSAPSLSSSATTSPALAPVDADGCVAADTLQQQFDKIMSSMIMAMPPLGTIGAGSVARPDGTGAGTGGVSSSSAWSPPSTGLVFPLTRAVKA